MNLKTHFYFHGSFQHKKPFEIFCNKTNWTRLYTLLATMFICSVSYGQSLNKNWKEDLTSTLEKFITCAATESDRTVCTAFIQESLASVYKLDVLYVEASNTQSATSGRVTNKGGQWSMLGMAFDQKALESAQRSANENKAVISVYNPAGAGVKHIALILPGDLQYSGSWGYNVPNSASFFITTPDKSYVNKGLSYAFAKSMLLNVTLYVRNN
jgi:hypothetical protein